MLTVRHEALINRPRDDVFAVAVVPENQTTWDPAGPIWVEKLDDRPLGVGSHYRGKWKKFGKVEWTFVAYDPPREFGHDARLPLGRFIHRLTFNDQGGATQFVQVLEAVAPKPLERVLAPVMKTFIKRRLVQLADELKEHMERQQHP